MGDGCEHDEQAEGRSAVPQHHHDAPVVPVRQNTCGGAE